MDIGPDKVLCVLRARFRGAASGAVVSDRHWAVVTVRDGRIARTELYSASEQALDAARARE